MNEELPEIKDVGIINSRLYSFRYDNLFTSEFEKKLHEWKDRFHLLKKAKENNIFKSEIDSFITEIFFDREILRKSLCDFTENNSLCEAFRPLKNFTQTLASLESSKMRIVVKEEKRLSRLRLYALRCDGLKYIITGGAIKFTLRMEDHIDTLFELERFEFCKNFLSSNENGINFMEEILYD